MLFILIVLVVSCIANAADTNNDIANHEVLFREWMEVHHKSYSTEAERALRFSVFRDNLALVKANSGRGSTATFGLNKFSDLTPSEFRRQYLRSSSSSSVSSSLRRLGARLRPIRGIPSVPIDWAKKGLVTPVKNQGQCGSGFIFAVVATIESSNMVLGRPKTPGSVYEIIECGNDNGTNFGCDGGEPMAVWAWVKSQGGLESEGCYPEHGDGQCHESECPVNPSPNLLLTGVVQLPPDENAMYNALTKSPIFVCVDASSWSSYTGGIIQASQCGTDIDHCVELTGYSPDQGGYWIMRNSWGEDWGQDGYVWVQFGQNACGITTAPVLAKA